MDKAELRDKIRACPNLPSSPEVAKRLIALMETESPDIEDMVSILASDSVLTAKILQLANSSFFPYKYKVTTLPKAAILIGYNGILATALSFTLVTHLKNEHAHGLNLELFWRRSLLAASVCRVVGGVCGRKDVEELFLVGLIQDIGMLVLDRVVPETYASESLDQFSHAKVSDHEIHKLGTTHAEVGSWLLTDWNFPAKICVAVQLSDESDPYPGPSGSDKFYNCVLLGVRLTQLLLNEARDEAFFGLVEFAENRLGLDPFAFAMIIKNIKEVLRETESLFEMSSKSDDQFQQLVGQAKTLLGRRNAQLAARLDSLFLQEAMPGVG
ncbi:MAG: HDOD domain-containing protein [Nitrospirales bacterium]